MRSIQSVAIVVFVACGFIAWGQAVPAGPAAPASKPLPPAAAGPAVPVAGANASPIAHSPPGPMYPNVWFSPETPADVQQRASCVIQINDSGMGPISIDRRGRRVGYEAVRGAPFDATTVALLLSTTALTEPVVQASLKQKPGLVGRQVLIAAASSGDRFVRLEISLKKAYKPWPNNAANMLLDALVKRLRTAAKESQKAEKAALASRLEVMTEKLAVAEASCKEISESRRSIEVALGHGIGYARSAGQNLKKSIGSTETNLTQLKARLAVLEAEPLTHYETSVKSAEKKLAKLTEDAKQGKATAEEIGDAAANLAKAKERLATARAATASSSRERLKSFREAGNTRANIADREARLESLKSQLAKLEAPGMAAKLANYRTQEQEERRLHNEIWSIVQNVRALQQVVREDSSLTLTVLDGAPVPEGIPEKSK